MATTVISEPVSVVLVINEVRRTIEPRKVFWRGQEYRLVELGMAHSERRGTTKQHVFTGSFGPLDMMLHLDSETLDVTLVAVSDGEPG